MKIHETAEDASYCDQRLTRSLQTADELTRIGVQSLGQLQDVVQRQDALPTFDLTDECPVQTAVISELLLTLAKRLTTSAHTLAKGLRRR
jgi:hypothetical protein